MVDGRCNNVLKDLTEDLQGVADCSAKRNERFWLGSTGAARCCTQRIGGDGARLLSG